MLFVTHVSIRTFNKVLIILKESNIYIKRFATINKYLPLINL